MGNIHELGSRSDPEIPLHYILFITIKRNLGSAPLHLKKKFNNIFTSLLIFQHLTEEKK